MEQARQRLLRFFVLNNETMSDSPITRLTDNYFADRPLEIEKILKRAMPHAVLTHKHLGNPIAAWKMARL